MDQKDYEHESLGHSYTFMYSEFAQLVQYKLRNNSSEPVIKVVELLKKIIKSCVSLRSGYVKEMQL